MEDFISGNSSDDAKKAIEIVDSRIELEKRKQELIRQMGKTDQEVVRQLSNLEEEMRRLRFKRWEGYLGFWGTKTLGAALTIAGVLQNVLTWLVLLLKPVFGENPLVPIGLGLALLFGKKILRTFLKTLKFLQK